MNDLTILHLLYRGILLKLDNKYKINKEYSEECFYINISNSSELLFKLYILEGDIVFMVAKGSDEIYDLMDIIGGIKNSLTL